MADVSHLRSVFAVFLLKALCNPSALGEDKTMLHYIYDPLCGWCYGAAPLIEVAAQFSAIRLHAGGMMTGSRRQQVTPELRQFVQPHDLRIAKLTGQPFSTAYTDGLLTDHSAVFDSAPPIAAILAAEQLAGKGLAMLSALQQAHYQQGRRIADQQTLSALASALALKTTDFDTLYPQMLHTGVAAHISQTRQLMSQLQAQGFPSMGLSTAQGIVRLDLTPWFGQPTEFAHWLQQQLKRNSIN